MVWSMQGKQGLKKYSFNQYYPLLDIVQVLELWDSVCDAIEGRESALAQLETFEKKASDPSRFFAKGQLHPHHTCM